MDTLVVPCDQRHVIRHHDHHPRGLHALRAALVEPPRRHLVARHHALHGRFFKPRVLVRLRKHDEPLTKHRKQIRPGAARAPSTASGCREGLRFHCTGALPQDLPDCVHDRGLPVAAVARENEHHLFDWFPKHRVPRDPLQESRHLGVAVKRFAYGLLPKRASG